MRVPASASRAVATLRRLDTQLSRYRSPDARDVLLDVRAPLEYATMAPVHAALAADPRLRIWLTSSEPLHDPATVYPDDLPRGRRISPVRAMTMRFDAYLAANLVWGSVPRGTCRVQMFHGVAGKYSRQFDRPAQSMREWDRLFFINQRRLRNFISAGAIDADSAAIRLVGMPRTDCLVDGSLRRDAILAELGLDGTRPTVLYAPTWTRYSSLNAVGEQVIRGLIDAGYTVLIKPHDHSFDLGYENSGGIDWAARLTPLLRRPTGLLARGGDASPLLAAADVLITDHSSVGFEFLLLDRPLIRIEIPELIRRADIPEEYVSLLASASMTVRTADETIAGVARALADPALGSNTRRAVARELFHDPGGATARAVREMYSLLELAAPPAMGVAGQEGQERL